MHRNPETLTTFFSSGMKRLLTSFDTKRERDTIFSMLAVLTSPTAKPLLDCPPPGSNLNALTQQTRGASRRPQLVWPRLASPRLATPRPGPNLN